MTSSGSLSVLTWNLLSTPDDQNARLSEISAAINSLAPDVVCVQEAWAGAASNVAQATGMRVLAHSTGNTHEGTAVLSKLPAAPGISSEQFELPGWCAKGRKKQACAATVVSTTGRRWRFTSAHLTWGSDREPTRLEQAQYLDDLAGAAHTRAPGTVDVLCGDLNALPESRTLRYLTGLDVDLRGSGTLWVDAWQVRGSGPGYTSDPTLARAEATARYVGIERVDLLPHRRIDYVLVRGFAHGRPGSPLTADLVPGGTATDHHGLLATLWDPTGDPSS